MANIMVIIDGMTDVPSEVLGGKTPFAYAHPQGILQIQQEGAFGEQNTVPAGFDVDSMNCIFTLLGVPAWELPMGRAYTETLALAIPTEDGDFVMRCNLVATDRHGVLTSSCGGALSAGTMEDISRALAQKSAEKLRFYPMSSYKNILVLPGAEALADQLLTLPPHQSMGKTYRELTPEYAPIQQFFADCQPILDAYATADTQYHLLVWGGCVKKSVPSFQALHDMRGAAVAQTEIVRGMALAMGLFTPKLTMATADVNTDLSEKLGCTLALAKEYDFVLVHLNGTDEASHRRDPLAKAQFISRIDKELIQPLLHTKHQLLVCTDHGTSSQTGAHMGTYQPFYLRSQRRGNLGQRAGIDAAKLFGEV